MLGHKLKANQLQGLRTAVGSKHGIKLQKNGSLCFSISEMEPEGNP